MVDNRKAGAPQTFDIHRSLPNRPHNQPPRPRREEPEEPPKEPKPKSKLRLIRRCLLLLVLLILAFSIFVGVWDSRNISSASKTLFGSGDIFKLLDSTALTTSSDGRVNVLIVGYSADDPGHQGADLTDSIILLSMSRQSHSGYMLSIPRDLYVDIPGFGWGKINEAYEDGGISLLEQIVNQDFATQIGYYAIVDYTAVRDTVKALGGVTVNIQSPDPRGLYDPNISKADGGPLLLKNGVQTIDGQTALNLTRARGDAADSYGFPQSDFDRTQHQRQIFAAIKAKLNWKLILNPRKNSRILNAVAANVKTNVQITEVRPLFGLFNSIPNTKLSSLSLNELNGSDLLQSYTTYSGQSALAPAAGLGDYSQIDSALSQYNN